ncbi:MAG: C10 family peptidase [Bacteroidales bacterium]|nr:C10 family peptidase [Bacteroidales bacterium]
MKKQIVFLVILLMSGIISVAQHVSNSEAISMARLFYAERHPDIQSVNEVDVSDIISIGKLSNPSIFIINLKNNGYVLISGDKRTPPVLAFSFEGKIEDTHRPPAFDMWINNYQNQIESYTNRIEGIDDPNNPEWTNLSEKSKKGVIKYSGDDIAPLIYSNWNQDWPYNEQCPSDPQGPGGHCYAGCVPTAMGMLMYYYRWPLTGTGSYSYTSPDYGLLSANFAQTSYKWNEMSFSISKTDSAMAQLLYHLGVSCDLVYGPDGSGMYNHKSAYSLKTFFKYSPQTQYVFRDSTNMNWDSILIAHLNRKMPMYYAGWSVPDINGHAFICDGYQGGSFFHFNFGWGGSSNGYFYTNNLSPGGNNFNLAQEVIINCYPDTLQYTYPAYCQGNSNINTIYGSIEDGSGPKKNYPSGSSCQWLISPQTAIDSVSNITLNFHRFATHTNDLVKVYDGSSASSPLIGSYSGILLPATITSSGNTLFITFNTSNQGEGFLASYESATPKWCSGTTILNEPTGIISDGSGDFWYNNSSLCIWRIQPPGVAEVALFFDEFDTETDKDKVRVYDMVSGTLLAEYSGTYASGSPPPPVVSPSGQMMMSFNTNMSVRSQGWKAHYESYMVGMNPLEKQNNCYLFPNPVTNNTILYTGNDHPLLSVDIYSLSGQLKHSQIISKENSQSELPVANFPAGIYIVKVNGFPAPVLLKLVKQ